MATASPSDLKTFLGDGGVFDAEMDEIGRRRHVLGDGERADLKQNLFGLALSGGGIRSATFALGVLQAMHACGVLRVFDYLSTVSGGGFVGGWWSAWLHREPRATAFPNDEGIEPQRAGEYMSRIARDGRVGESSMSAGSDPLHHLRLFSNYLTPRKGLLSGDFWRAIAIVSRNLVTTWLILIPVLFAVVLVGQLYFAFQPEARARDVGKSEFFHPLLRTPAVVTPPAPGAAVASPEESAAYAAKYRGYAANREKFEENRGTHRGVLWRRAIFGLWPVLAIYLMGLFMGITWFLTLERERGWLWLLFVTGALVALLACALSAWVGAGAAKSALIAFVSSPRLLVLTLAFLLLVLWRVWWATMGMRAPLDVQRNRLTQEHAKWLVALVASAALLTVAGFGHEIAALFKDWTINRVASAGGWLAALGAVAGAAFTAFKAAPAGGRDSNSVARPWAVSRLVFALSPPLFVAVLAVACAWASHAMLAQIGRVDSWSDPLIIAVFIGIAVSLVLALIELHDGHRTRAFLLLGLVVLAWAAHVAFQFLDDSWNLVHLVAALLALALAWVITLGWTIDPNAISLHQFYKSRIVRAYLGASNINRAKRRSEVTDAVEGDDIRLKDLEGTRRGGPLHLVNTTLNLVGGSDLATAQRSAAAFTLSQLYCGSTRTGYRRTDGYMAGTLTLGTAVAVSGAAASPNMGAASPSAALAMLMALFNVRLGYWAPTPNRASWMSPQPRLWPYYVLREFLSQTNDTSTYCYLTDGGHFDNTGLYALVERGCRFIVIVDDGADPLPCFEDVGAAIRRCKIDFGAEICLDVAGFQKIDGKSASQHFTVGTIEYSLAHATLLGWTDLSEKGRTGIVVWIKPSLTGDEPADVRQYALQNADFPQQTTLDQWFGESQFESYRKLGESTARQTFAPMCGELPVGELRERLLATPTAAFCSPPAASPASPAST